MVLACGDSANNVRSKSVTITLDAEGVPDYTALWAEHLGCDAGGGIPRPKESTPVRTALQKAVVAAAHQAGYTESDDATLYAVYQYCGSNRPTDYYATSSDFSDSQVKEIQAWMVLCPNHPQAEHWRAAIANTGEVRAAEQSGAIVYNGTYKVPSEMQRGTFVVTDVKNCYWETRDGKGRIIDNNFVLAAPRVEAVVGAGAVVFTSRGCGQWTKQ